MVRVQTRAFPRETRKSLPSVPSDGKLSLEMRIGLIIAAGACFLLASFGVVIPVIALVPFGLALYMASLLVKSA